MDALKELEAALESVRNRPHSELEHSLIKAVFKHLRDKGVTQIVVNYDGYGDSGTVEEAKFLPDGIDKSFESSVSAINDMLGDWTSECLSDHHPGWEINEGSVGRATFDVTVDPPAVHVEHGWRETILSDESSIDLELGG